VTREPIGRTVPGGGLDGTGKVPQQPEQRQVVGAPDSLISPIDGPMGDGMRVPHPEERIPLPLRQQVRRIKIRKIPWRSPQHPPPSSIGTKPSKQLAGLDPGSPYGNDLTTNTYGSGSPTPLDKPHDHMQHERGPHLIGGREP